MSFKKRSFKKRPLLVLVAVVALLGLIWNSGGDSDFDEVAHASAQIDTPLDSKIIEVGEVNLHVVFAGPEDGEPVIFIHGFPEYWYMWRHHIDALAKAGYRVAAPDMRGYNRSDRPKGKDAYQFSDYAGDITGLMDSQGWESANIVGHDIGARVSWGLVFDSPERVKRAVIYSVGHPMAFAASTEKSGTSWYRTFFKMPILPQFSSRIGGLSLTAKSMKKSSREGTYTDEELAIYKAAWNRNHAFDTMIGAYSHFDETIKNMPQDGAPKMPVLFVYGLDDQFISSDIAERTKSYLGKDNVIIHPNLSHWLLAEEPAMTAAEIQAFFAKPLQLNRSEPEPLEE